MGDWLALLSAGCFAASNVTITRGVGANGQDNGAFLSILLTAGISGALWLGQGAEQGWPAPHPLGALWFAGAGILTIFVGRVFSYASIQHLGAVRASVAKRLIPLFSILLAVLLLGESFDLAMLLGMLLIGSGFVVLILQALKARVAERGGGSEGRPSWASSLGSLGFYYGPVSALAYAFGYIARKEGLTLMPDPAFGTMLGSVVGGLVFVLVAQFVPSYRTALRQTFRAFNPLLLAAGVLSTAGQLFYFAALSHSTISRVAMISSIEAFLTILFSVMVARSFKQLNGPVLLAAALGVAGTVLLMVHR